MPLGNAKQCAAGVWSQSVEVCNPAVIGVPLAKSCTTAIDAIVLDDDPTAYTSAAIDTTSYDYGMLFLDIAVTLVPTDVLIEVLTSCDDSAYFTIMDGPLGDLRYDDTACPRTEAIAIPYFCKYIKIRATGTGTGAANKFTVTAKVCLVTNSY